MMFISKCFKQDPVYNIHHKHEDVEQLSTHWLREKYWSKKFPYVVPNEIFLGLDEKGKKKCAQHVSIRDTLTVLLRDARVKEMVQESFKPRPQDSILRDFTDGSAFHSHQCEHDGHKCLQLILFQDAFDFNAFGPAKGVYKPVGFYFTLGNLPPEYRSKVDLVMLAYMILEKHLLKESVQEQLSDSDRMKEVLKPLLQDLLDLKTNGIKLDGETLPVCLIFLLGDNLGQHQIGGFIRNFAAQFFCRFCSTSREMFLRNPTALKQLRTPQEYDAAVLVAKEKWSKQKRRIEKAAKKKIKKQAKQRAEKVASRCSAPAYAACMTEAISKDALQNLRAISFQGVKYRPSPFNSESLKYHVSGGPSQAPCVAHDLYEGLGKVFVAKVLNYCICVKKWFDLDCLNNRIKTFRCRRSDASDPPKPFKNLDQLNGNAVQNWNFIRLLPFIIGDLIKDPEDEVWQLYLTFKEICEFVCAPTISLEQVAYLRSVIDCFVSQLKLSEEHFSKCFIPKLHFLCHYPDLITIFGPLIRLFTLRYESKHMFFEKVMKVVSSYINVTATLASKYVSSFAYNHSSGIIPPDIECNASKSKQLYSVNLTEEEKKAFPPDFCFHDFEEIEGVKFKGIQYNLSFLLIVGQEENFDLRVGQIQKILLSSSNILYFLCEELICTNSFQGYYLIKKSTHNKKFILCKLADFSDYYPLPAYNFQGEICFTLKHSSPCMV